MNKKYIFLLLAFSFLFHLNSHAQRHLEQRVDSLIDLAKIVVNNNADSLAIVANQVYDLAHGSSYTYGWANAARIKGIATQFKNEYDSSIGYYKEAIRLFEQINDTLQVARTYYNIATVYNLKADYEQTIEYGLKTIQVFKSLGDANGEGRVYNLMGIAANVRKDYEQSIAYFRQYSQKVTSAGDSSEMATSYSNMGSTFQSMGQPDSAIYYLSLAEKIYLQTGGHRNMTDIYQNLGTLYEHSGEAERAKEYHKKSMELAVSTGNRLREAGGYYNIGQILNSQRRWQEAISNLTQSMQIAEEIYDLEILYKSNKEMAHAKAALGKYNEAYDFLSRSAVYRDSLFSIEKTKATQELQTRYEAEKKEQQIEHLHQETAIQQLKLRQRGVLLIGIILLLSSIAILIYFIQNRRKIRSEARLQQEATRKVLLAEEQERRRIAGDLHDGIGQMLSASLLNLNQVKELTGEHSSTRQALERSLALLSESYDEMRSISHQMMPNALLKAGLGTSVREFIEKINNPDLQISLAVVGFSDRIDEQVETVLYRVIQEAVNNVIKHAEASKLSIQLTHDEDGIDLTIEDDGKGFEKMSIANFDGIGIRNIQSRITLLNGTLEIDTSPGKGTLLAIHIP
jgi:two-component system NarL family sensor kinase